MLQIEVDTAGTVADLRKLERDLDREMQTALKLAGRVVQAEARRRAPVSPTKAQAKGTGYRFDHKKSPNTLVNAIKIKVGRGFVDVGVMMGNALKYAGIMHDGSYKLGPGSKAKQSGGEKVGPKFLERAYEDNEREVQGIFEGRASAAVTRIS